MPRKSPDAVSALAVVERMPPEARAAPPDRLSPEEAEQWRMIVSRMPLGWFTVESQAMLASLCSQLVTSQALEQDLREFSKAHRNTEKGRAEYREIVKLHLDVVKVAATLATKLRLTPQSRYDRISAASAHRRTAKEVINTWDVADGTG